MSDTLPDALAQAWSVTKYAVYHSAHISVIGSCFDLYISKNNNNGPVLVSRDGRHRHRSRPSRFYPVTSYTRTYYYMPRNRSATVTRRAVCPSACVCDALSIRFVIPSTTTANVAPHHTPTSQFLSDNFPPRLTYTLFSRPVHSLKK